MVRALQAGVDLLAPSASAKGNDQAKRVLLTIRQKLSGAEHTEGHILSVAAQVRRLIDEAQDPKRLCVLFPGWQPWV